MAEEKIYNTLNYLWDDYFPKSISKYVRDKELSEMGTGGGSDGSAAAFSKALYDSIVAEMGDLEDSIKRSMADSSDGTNAQIEYLELLIECLALLVLALFSLICCCLCPYTCYLKRKEYKVLAE